MASIVSCSNLESLFKSVPSRSAANSLIMDYLSLRNALGAVRALSAASYSLATDGMHLVRFDDVIDVMYATGIDMQSKYRETAQGGLAKIMRERFNKR